MLLVREISDGAWTLPGGWADVNQSAAECVVREVAEESGYMVRAVKLAAVYDYRKRNRPLHLDSIYKMFFICELVGGSASASMETSEAAFFAPDALPPLSVGRTTAAQIEPHGSNMPRGPNYRRISIEYFRRHRILRWRRVVLASLPGRIRGAP